MYEQRKKVLINYNFHWPSSDNTDDYKWKQIEMFNSKSEKGTF